MVGILLIATRNYKQFVLPLIKQIEKDFLPNKQKVIYLFTDGMRLQSTIRMPIVHFDIGPLKYPLVTLYRYKFFHEQREDLRECSHLFYLDVDMAVVDTVCDEILTDTLMAVRHPGFYKNDGWGDASNPPESKSFLPTEMRKHYYCGGVQGGRADLYLTASKKMSEGISEDEKIGVKAEWNDETFWNHYIHTAGVPITEFTPSYCMVEGLDRRKEWGIDDLEVKIIALDKDHKSIRE